MHSNKSLGPDGFSALFFQKTWHIIGSEVMEAVLVVLNNGEDLTDWNNTLLTLIPKVKDPLIVKDFLPITLCNTCYKIISRAITNRFRPILVNIIDDHQSTFIPSRLITDNILLGFECMHWIRHRKKHKTRYAALNLNMSKHTIELSGLI